jgi:hypothetical protein
MSLYRILLLSLCAAATAVATPALARPQGEGLLALARSHGISTPAPARPHDEASRLAWNDRPRDQDRAFRATQEGRSMPLPQIERRVLPHMGGADYLGPEFRGRNYRLKFMDNGRVIWVDVDAATGRIVGKSGD